MYVGPPLYFLTGGFPRIDQWKFKFLGGGKVGWQGFPRVQERGGGGGKNVTYYVGTWQLTIYRVPLNR